MTQMYILAVHRYANNPRQSPFKNEPKDCPMISEISSPRGIDKNQEWTLDSGLWSLDYHPWTLDSGLRNADLQNVECRL